MDAENFHRLKAMAGHSYWFLGTAYSRYPEGRDAAYRLACHATGRLMAQGARGSRSAHVQPGYN